MRHRGMFALILCSAISYTPHILAAVEQGPMFVLSVLVSSSDGVWCGTEGEGLYHCVDREKGWVRDKEFEAIGGTNVFALCEDAYGRIWAGTLDSGVCIKDRLGWHRLSIEEGLSGCHVFALGADADGNVWIATESGVDRYSTTSVSLTFYDRSTGFCVGQISSIVIDRLGNVLLGTACNGLYKMQKVDSWRSYCRVPVKSRNINSIAVNSDAELFVASNEGIECWKFFRPTSTTIYSRNPGHPKPTAVFCSGKCKVVGLEEHGIRYINKRAKKYYLSVVDECNNYRITSISGNESFFVAGTYGSGVLWHGEIKQLMVKKKREGANYIAPRHVRPANFFSNVDTKKVGCFSIGDDWSTKGDWCGRYGLRMAVLCAQHAQWGDEVICSDPRYKVRARIGDNKNNGEVMRRWLHWKFTTNLNSLYNPHIGHRRQSEWDDHSEAYPQSFEGPNLVITVDIPKGMHEIALYFFNKDGEIGQNFRRDYKISVYDGDNIADKPLEVARVWRFRNGVYKRFALLGGARYSLVIERGNSFSTILSGVFIQKINESQEWQARPRLSTCLHYGGLVYREPRIDRAVMICDDGTGYDYDLAMSRIRTEYRKAMVRGNGALKRATEWILRKWDNCERQRFDEAMLSAWTCMQMKNPRYRLAIDFPYSPNVINQEIKPNDYGQESPLFWIDNPLTQNKAPVRRMSQNFYWRVVNLQGEMGYLND